MLRRQGGRRGRGQKQRGEKTRGRGRGRRQRLLVLFYQRSENLVPFLGHGIQGSVDVSRAFRGGHLARGANHGARHRHARPRRTATNAPGHLCRTDRGGHRESTARTSQRSVVREPLHRKGKQVHAAVGDGDDDDDDLRRHRLCDASDARKERRGKDVQDRLGCTRSLRGRRDRAGRPQRTLRGQRAWAVRCLGRRTGRRQRAGRGLLA